MTDAQQLEYIITEDELDTIATHCTQKQWDDGDYKIYHTVRSRPHTQATERIIGKQTCEAFDDAKFPVFVQGTGWIGLEDAKRLFASEAARTATLAAYDKGIAEIQKRIDGVMKAFDGETNEKITEKPFLMADGMNECILMLKSLRQQAGEQG